MFKGLFAIVALSLLIAGCNPFEGWGPAPVKKVEAAPAPIAKVAAPAPAPIALPKSAPITAEHNRKISRREATRR